VSDSKKKLRILREILGEPIRVGKEHLFQCPKCNHHKKKLSVNLNKDKFKCWVCEYSGSTVYRLVRRLGSFKQQNEWQQFLDERLVDLSSFEQVFMDALDWGASGEEELQRTPLPSEFVSLTGRDLPSSAIPALKFLAQRGLNTDDVLRWKVGYCATGEYANRVLFPSFDIRGSVNYFVARAYDNSWKKYTNPPAKRNIVFNELYVDWQSDLSLVEGVFDAVVAGNAVPILGSSLRDDSKLFRQIVKHDTPVYVAMDSDAEKKAMNLIKKLLTFDIELYKVDISPYSDVGEMTREEYQKRKNNAVPMTVQEHFSKSIAAI